MNNDSNFLKIYKELVVMAENNNTTTKKVLQDFLAFYEKFLTLELEKEYNNRTKDYGVKQICEKYKMSPKKFYELIKKGTGVEIQKRRDLKSIILNATKGMNLTKEEQSELSRYFEKKEITAEKVVEKLHKLRS